MKFREYCLSVQQGSDLIEFQILRRDMNGESETGTLEENPAEHV